MSRSLGTALPLAILPGLLHAGGWQFAPAMEVTQVQGDKVFHHLESSGRRSIAVADGRVAVVWEDERDGLPRIYVASKGAGEAVFGTELSLSGAGEAFEPAVVALDGGRFAVAWEEDEAVWVRLLRFEAGGAPLLGDAIRLGSQPSGQVSLAGADHALLATWSERQGRHREIQVASLAAHDDLGLSLAASCRVDPETPSADQLYPTVAAVAQGTVIAWEDRRPGHTIIMAARSLPGAVCAYSAPQRVSEEPPGPAAPFGKGHGVSRVALATHGNDGLLAAWADKRDFRHGYDIWGARLAVDGRFAANERIQDDFGELSQQWHTALAGHPDGRVVVAWDDNREGHADIALSWPEQDGWSEDLLVAVAAGPGEQQHPSITFDADGRLHLAWVHRDQRGGPTRLRYSVAGYQAD